MRFRHWTTALALIFAVAGLTASVQLARARKKDRQSSSANQMDAQKRALHALNRLTFGPRPGDLERVQAVGVDRWIDLQLHPEKIDDSALDARLAPLRTLRMDTREIVENFPPPQLIRAVADGKQPLPRDPTKRAVYEAQVERYNERQERKQEEGVNSANGDASTKPAMAAGDDQQAQRRENRLYADLKLDQLLNLTPEQRVKAVLNMSPADQLALAPSLRSPAGQRFMTGMSSQQQETLFALGNPQQVVAAELVEGTLLRDIYSERQLQEVMTDFWLNHFNVFIGKGADRYLLTSYQRDVIRPRALGKFEDLLVATAQSPAMLFYLDNWLSVGPDSDFAKGIPRRPANFNPRRRFPPPNRPMVRKPKGNRNGLNENYGRELMELHTLGVNGGYTQQDVIQVARAFTGWTLERPREGGAFVFNERMHEPGTKIVLGHKIKPAGEKEGLEVLHILAHNPATAKFICAKLAVRFVSDNPPPSLVDRMAKTFLKKDGDIRDVLETMFQSPEFWAPDAYRAKVKTPLEFVVSAVRASGAAVSNALPLARELQVMGMPLYGAQPPTGYSTKANAWVNSSALLDRMNFALALTGNKLRGSQVDDDRLLGAAAVPSDPQQTLAMLENTLLDGDVSKQTHDTIAARLHDPKISERRLDDPARPPNVGMIAGLLLGSPEFQRR
jgi:uncharacterized protein (DUF1800 family)